MDRLTQAGLLILAVAATLALVAIALAQTWGQGDLRIFSWTALWLVPVGAGVAFWGVLRR